MSECLLACSVLWSRFRNSLSIPKKTKWCSTCVHLKCFSFCFAVWKLRSLLGDTWFPPHNAEVLFDALCQSGLAVCQQWREPDTGTSSVCFLVPLLLLWAEALPEHIMAMHVSYMLPEQGSATQRMLYIYPYSQTLPLEVSMEAKRSTDGCSGGVLTCELVL